MNNRGINSHQNEVRSLTDKVRNEDTYCENWQNVDLILSALYKDWLLCSLGCFQWMGKLQIGNE